MSMLHRADMRIPRAFALHDLLLSDDWRRHVSTTPGFTAEASLETAKTRSRGAARRTHDVHAISAQQRTAMRSPDVGGGTLEPATTCTCPCCQTVGGRLVCC
jgi:hypothetical protein